MSYADELVGNCPAGKKAVISVLNESFHENDISNRPSFVKLSKPGFQDDEILTLPASHKSLVKYGCRLSLSKFKHILSLYHGNNLTSELPKRKKPSLGSYAADNHGKLLYYSPRCRADVHGNLSGRVPITCQ